MFDEIGSNFYEELNTSLTTLTDTNSIFYLDSGRSAIRLVLKSIKVPKKKAILPAFTCETVILPFVESGYDIEYYNIDKNLLVDFNDFQQLIKQSKPSVVLVHAYFGFDTIKNIREYLAKLSNEGIIVIEDLTHSLLMSNRVTCSDFCVGSLRKWNGIPDGGFLAVCKNKYNVVTSSNENTEYLTKRNKAQELKRQYVKTLDNSIKEKYRVLFSASEEVLDSQKAVYTMSVFSRRAIVNTDYEMLKKRRSSNYNYLLQAFSNRFKQLIIPSALCNQVEVPLYFVILLDNRELLQAFMAKQNIYLPIIWPMPPQVKEILTNSTKYIYKHILAIPCDQRYYISDMERIVNSFCDYYNRKDRQNHY